MSLVRLFLLAGIAASPTLAVADQPTRWVIDHDNSELAFYPLHDGREFKGVFEQFEAEMRFSETLLGQSQFDVTVDVTSANTRNRDRDQAMASSEWMYVSQYPEARFVTSEIRAADDGGFEAEGELTIRDATQTIVLPFEWTTHDDHARLTAEMQAEIVLNRTDFNIGVREFAEDGTVGHRVRVAVDLILHAE